MRQMAVITPYAQFLFKFVSDVPEYVSISVDIFSLVKMCAIFLY